MSDLITLSDWQTQRGMPNVTSPQESLIISQCSARIEEFLGRTLLRTNYTEILSGNGTQEITLKNRPVLVTGLTVLQDDQSYWGQAPNAFDPVANLLVQGVDYGLKVDQPDGTSRCGILVRLQRVWTRPPVYRGGVIDPTYQQGSGNIQVQYTAGYATIPLDIQQACMSLCAVVKSRARLGEAFEQESRENYSYRLRPLVRAAFAGLPADTLGVLARYRNIGVG